MSEDVRVYVGRFISTGYDEPHRLSMERGKEAHDSWTKLIDCAEGPLIFSCSFPYNSSSVRWMDFKQENYSLINLGERLLLPMIVSTESWREYFHLGGKAENSDPKELYWKWNKKE